MKNDKTFCNLDNVTPAVSLTKFLRWQAERLCKNKDFSYAVPQAGKTEVRYLAANRFDTTITWIGHATFFIQQSGLNILTDPVWATRMGLAKRLVPPGITITDMPAIDVILISHNHYDHLDIDSLRRLKGKPLLLVPQGLGSYMQEKGFSHIKEFNWWQQTTVGDALFTFVPSQHWSKRTLWDTNRSLWGGWMVQHSDEKPAQQGGIYFVGDSGYFRGFHEIGQRFPVQYVLMPIGAYEPEWFMSIQHVTPEEAVQAYLDIKAKYFVPMHYDAFRLGDETPKEALDRLHAAWQDNGLDFSNLKILRRGETIGPAIL